MNIKQLLEDLREFVEQEQRANQAKLNDTWQKPLAAKLLSGESQHIAKVQVNDLNSLTLTLGKGDSRFREGDMLRLYQSNPREAKVWQATIEAETDNQWLVRTVNQDLTALHWDEGNIYADIDGMDLSPFYHKALNELAESHIGRTIVLPLLAGELDSDFIYTDNYDEAADAAEALGLNDSQIDAVAKGVAAKYLACIQGPPGTGKTQVISVIVKQLIAEGQRVLLTSHTHMAINNALNKIAQHAVPLVKVGAAACVKGLHTQIKCVGSGDAWQNRPDSGYVIGATPFATCSTRLEHFQFDTVIFDEASQITVPLALMAMRKARRYIFVGDHQQLPPVVLSKSVLNSEGYSIFAKLVANQRTCMSLLNQTYRMNTYLSQWPSERYYEGALVSAGSNAQREFSLPKIAQKYVGVLSGKHSMVFIKSPGKHSKTFNVEEAHWVIDLITTAHDAGLALKDIGVVTPFRSHAKLLRTTLRKALGMFSTNEVVVDTVERMQGQEREMIILSLCSTDPQFISNIASFLFQSTRLNVAITRAKTKLIILGPQLADNFSIHGDTQLAQHISDYRSLSNHAYQYSIEES